MIDDNIMTKLNIIIFNTRNNLYSHCTPEQLKDNAISVIEIYFLNQLFFFPSDSWLGQTHNGTFKNYL